MALPTPSLDSRRHGAIHREPSSLDSTTSSVEQERNQPQLLEPQCQWNETTPLVDSSSRTSIASTSNNNDDPNEVPASTATTTAAAAQILLQSQEMIAKQESRSIFLLRLMVLAVMAVSTALIASTVLYVARQSERQQFEQSYSDAATALLDRVGATVFSALGDIDTLLTNVVTFARYTNQTWPCVVYPGREFAVQVSKLRQRSHLACVNTFHVVSPEQRQEWEEFAYSHDDWVYQGLLMHQTKMSNTTNATIDAKKSSSGSEEPLYEQYQQLRARHIMGADGNPFVSEDGVDDNYLLTLWQESPVVPRGKAYNWEFSTVYQNPVYREEAIQHKTVVMAEVYNVPTQAQLADPDKKSQLDQASQAIRDYIQFLDPTRDPSEPLSDIIYPILLEAPDSVHVAFNKDASSSSSRVVGMSVNTIFWSDMIRQATDRTDVSIYFIMENACQQVFSYRMDGGSVLTYLGPGDHHDPRYDEFAQVTTFQELAAAADVSSNDNPSSMTAPSSTTSTTYTGLPLSGKGCPFRLRVYPTADYEARFVTRTPMVYTINVLIVFGLVAALFCIWDSCEEKRKQLFVRTILDASANVKWLEDMIQERTRQICDTNRQLERANRRLATASAAQLQSFASMSHEIRTPLNCIIGLSGLLSQETELTPSQQESINMIVSSSDLLLAVVNDVLDYSKLESGNVEIEVQPTSLQQLLTSVLYSIETKAIDNKLQLVTRYDPTVGAILRTDGRRLQQILYNLLGNATKFSHPGSSIEFTLTIGPHRKRNSGSSYTGYYYSPGHGSMMNDDDDTTDDEDDNFQNQFPNSNEPVLCFGIKNYGQGIAARHMKKIFKPFRQSNLNRGVSCGGTGLGLAITTKLVHAMSGKISATSVYKKWALFEVEFPLSSVMEPADVSQLSRNLKNSNVTVALVCQEPQVVRQLKASFAAFSMELAVFKSMQELRQCDLFVSPMSNGSLAQRNMITLVHEDLYNPQIYAELCESKLLLGPSLITFGPNHSVPDSRDHFRSIVRLIPSVLMEYLLSTTVGPVHAPTVSSTHPAVMSVPDAITYQNYRVLIAEDNIINQKVLLRMLSRLGLQHLDVVDNGQKAVDLEVTKPFDAILMDMQMPVMDGVEACERILARHAYDDGTNGRRKSVVRHPFPKIFFVTAHAGTEFEQVCHKAGASGFLSKPFNIQDIEHCLQKLHRILLEESEVTDDLAEEK